MMKYFKKAKISVKVVTVFVCIGVFVSSLGYALSDGPRYSCANIVNMPMNMPLLLVKPNLNTKSFHLPVLRGIEIDPKDLRNLKFYFDSMSKARVEKKDMERFIKYFLGFLTIPQEDLWVNLSPYEKDTIIPDSLIKLDIGKDFLLEDYVLKQLTSTLTDLQTPCGRRYWKEVYKEAQVIAGTTKLSISTFHKVWIMPDKAEIYVYENMVFIKKAQLKVLLDEDYQALIKNGLTDKNSFTKEQEVIKRVNAAAKEIFKKQILPLIQERVNNSPDFSPLRQLFHALVLASYFKDKLKNNAVYGNYVDARKTEVLGIKKSSDIKEKIYEAYLEAFKQGAYNYLKKEYDPKQHKKLMRRYHSGGVVGKDVKEHTQTRDVGLFEDVKKTKEGGIIESALVHMNSVIQPETKIEKERKGVIRQYHYALGGFNVHVENPNENYCKTSAGVMSVGMSMLHRLLYPQTEDYPGIFIAPSSDEWIGSDGTNLMQIYFAIACNFGPHKRKTKIVCTKEQKERIIKYLQLGNPYYLPNVAGYSEELMARFRREAIYLADRAKINDKTQMATPYPDMVEWIELSENGEAKVGDVVIQKQNDGTYSVNDKGKITVLEGRSAKLKDLEMQVSQEIKPLTQHPEFGVTFLGTSSGMDPNGLSSNQIIWAGANSLLVDVGPATVYELQALGLTPQQIPYVMITHMHEDHMAGALRYFSWCKEQNVPIKLVMEPGIYELLKEQMKQVLGVNLEDRFNIQLIPLKFYETLTLGQGEEAAEIEAIPAFHGTPTSMMRVTYKKQTISHSSDTTLDPYRFEKIRAKDLPDNIRDDFKREGFDPDGLVFDQAREKELIHFLFQANKFGNIPAMVIYEGGTQTAANANGSNHTTPLIFTELVAEGVLTQESVDPIVFNHAAKLPEGLQGIPQGKPMSTVLPGRTFGEKLNLLRKLKGWSASQVAKKLDETEAAIWHLEKRQQKTQPETIAKYAQLYGVPQEWLIGQLANDEQKKQPADIKKEKQLMGDIGKDKQFVTYDMLAGKLFGERLTILRKSKGLTLQQVADALYVSAPTVMQVERTENPRVETIKTYATLYGVPQEWLINQLGEKEKKVNIEQAVQPITYEMLAGKSFGEKLEMLRKSKGWTLLHISQMLGITERAVRHVKETQRPQRETIVRYAQLFGVPEEWLEDQPIGIEQGEQSITHDMLEGKSFGEKLKILRELKGWSVAQVTKKLDETEMAIRHLEKRQQKPQRETIAKYAQLYGVPEEWLKDDTLKTFAPHKSAQGDKIQHEYGQIKKRFMAKWEGVVNVQDGKISLDGFGGYGEAVTFQELLKAGFEYLGSVRNQNERIRIRVVPTQGTADDLGVNVTKYYNETTGEVEYIFDEQFVVELTQAFNSKHRKAAVRVIAERLYHEGNHSRIKKDIAGERQEEKENIYKDLAFYLQGGDAEEVIAYFKDPEMAPKYHSGYYFGISKNGEKGLLLRLAELRRQGKEQEVEQAIEEYLRANYPIGGEVKGGIDYTRDFDVAVKGQIQPAITTFTNNASQMGLKNLLGLSFVMGEVKIEKEFNS